MLLWQQCNLWKKEKYRSIRQRHTSNKCVYARFIMRLKIERSSYFQHFRLDNLAQRLILRRSKKMRFNKVNIFNTGTVQYTPFEHWAAFNFQCFPRLSSIQNPKKSFFFVCWVGERYLLLRTIRNYRYIVDTKPLFVEWYLHFRDIYSCVANVLYRWLREIKTTDFNTDSIAKYNINTKNER